MPTSSRRSSRALSRRFSNTAAFLGNLYRGLRVAFFMRVEPREWRAAVPQLLVLAVIVIGIEILLQRTFYPNGAAFNWYALQTLWFDLAVFLLVGWLVSRFATRAFDPLIVPVALYAATFIAGLLCLALIHTARASVETGFGRALWVGAYYGYYAWFFLLAVVLLRRSARLTPRHLAISAVPLLGFIVFSLLLPSPQFWYQPPPTQAADAEESSDSPVSEEMLYLQPRLAREVIGNIQEQRAGISDLYFVGFAPYGEEDVFLKESEVIHKLMDERFGARGRSILLVNNNKTLRKYPLATVTNLRATLKTIGEQMDPRDDMLVLYLTSHGSKDHRLSADYWPLQLNEVDPVTLKKMLDDAGIRWRVIIVSACYAGGFIEPLRGSNTLVMTAADATRTSFGCGAESEFTYFAKALFDEQLRETYSFEEAFTRALPVILEREKAAGAEPSNPQIAMGEEMRRYLGRIEGRLRASVRR